MKNDMARIPYVVHKKHMFEAYRREKLWRGLFVGSMLLWVLGAIVAFVVV